MPASTYTPGALRHHFLLDPAVTFLNHGSFGACPRPVFEEYQRLQLELEREPVDFLGRRSGALLAQARADLAAFLGAAASDVVYFPNPTTAANAVARSLKLGPGDEVLTTDHEYGAIDRTWHFLARQSGFTYRNHPMPLPVTTHADFVERFWAAVTPRTRVIAISHLTTSSALIFPVAEICRRAREAGLFTVVDGAHAPAHIPVDLAAIGADCYLGACHKWLCAPKGSAFLYARREVQDQLMPLVVSWGYESTAPSGSQFIDYHEWQGTRDIAAYLATPAAIRFQAEHDWPAVRAACHTLALETRERLNARTGCAPICPPGDEWVGQMVAIRLPAATDVGALGARLWADYRIEIPVYRWNDQPLLRLSVQAYTTPADIDRLLTALGEFLPAD
jgi:isopenicillin-N epimerase